MKKTNKKTIHQSNLLEKFIKLIGVSNQKNKNSSKKTSGDAHPKAVFIGGEQDSWRFYWAWAIIVLLFVVLVGKAVWIQVINVDFYLKQGEKILTKKQKMPTTRGMILDTNGVPLAANAPLSSVYFSPYDYAVAYYDIKKALGKADEGSKKHKKLQESLAKMDLKLLEQATGYPLKDLQAATKIDDSIDVNDKEAVAAALPNPKAHQARRTPLLKDVPPEIAKSVMKLQIKGVFEEPIKKRYYLQPEPNAQLIGYMANSKDDKYVGTTGIERKYQEQLAGKEGVQLILRAGNASDNSIQQIRELEPHIEGQDIELTIDARLQYILYRELAELGRLQSALSSSGIVVDVHTGDVLAMTSWPSVNTNELGKESVLNTKNRVVADTFEPGSVIKPFTVAAALDSGKYNVHSLIDTSPGSLRLGNYTIKDAANYGAITMTRLIQKSSNVASAKIALSLSENAMFDIQQRFGFGKKTGLNLPTENAGILKRPKDDRARRATMAYGYGQSVTLVQLAQAYAALGNEGVMNSLRVVKGEKMPEPIQVIKPEHAQSIVAMMRTVTETGGTGTAAAINGYHVAGKTGTSRRANTDPNKKGYLEGQYRNIFAGVAPATNPRFAVVILVEDPQKQKYAGQTVAPVFAKVMKETLRLYNVPFDKALDVAKE